MATRLRRFTLSDQSVGVLFMVPFVLTALFFMVYPIVADIPIMLIEDALPASSVGRPGEPVPAP